MRPIHLRLAILAAAAACLPGLLSHCGGGSHATPTDAGAGSEAAGEASSDHPTSDDAATGDSSRGDDGAAGVDSGAETTADADDTADSGNGDDTADSADSADEGDGADAASSLIPCVADGGDGGDGGAVCPPLLSCCGGFCVDTSKDPRNCGSCGNPCSSTQFCTGTACDEAVVKNVCSNSRATWSTDRFASDNTAGAAIGAALSTGCVPAVTVVSADQTSGMAQDPTTARPITGAGDTFVAGGGYFGQGGVAYMDNQGLTPLIVGTDGTNAWIRNRKTSQDIVSVVNATSLTPHHDYFVVETSVEPNSGTLCFFGYGMGAPGTVAAGYYVQNSVVGPNLSTFTDTWYAYEWTDLDNDGAPSPADTFTLVAHGT